MSQNLCGSTIFRVSDYSSGPGTVSAYANAPGVDGLTFDNVSGSLYAESNGHVLRIDGTRSPTPGHVDSVAKVPYADGLAFGEHSSGQPPYLVANRNNGTATRVDFRLGLLPTQQDIFTGGSRGDFAAVDSHGCLYITQSASVVRIAGSGQSCGLEPTTQGPAPRAALAVHSDVSPRGAGSGAKACVKVASVRLRVSQAGGVRLRSATVYVNGRPVKRLRGAGVTAPFVISHLPRSSFTVKIVAVTTSGRELVSIKRYDNCATPPSRPCGAAVTLAVPQRPGARAVTVAVSVAGRRTLTAHGHSVQVVRLVRAPRGRFTAKLVTHYTRGGPATVLRTFPACSR